MADSPQNTGTRPQRRRDRKHQLAAVASELFCARGYHGVGVNEIAAAAGVTGPALYRHFTDKQTILAHVLLSGLDDIATATSEALTKTNGVGSSAATRAQIEAMLTALATQAVDRREVAALWRWEGRHLARADQREIARRSNQLLEAWRQVLTDQRPRLPAADAELLCWAALSVFGSVSMHRTSVAKRQFVRLLVRLAHRVLHATLPVSDVADSASARTAFRVGMPSRREQLLGAATELFHRYGFHTVSMEDIGAAAGIAGPSVYRHFASKASLLTAICKRAADRLMLGAEQALRTSAPADEGEALRKLIESYVRTLVGSAELTVSFSEGSTNVAEPDRVELVRVQRDYVAQWVQLLCVADPDLTPREAKITVHAALTIANDLARTRKVRDRPGLHRELVTLMTTVLGLD